MSMLRADSVHKRYDELEVLRGVTKSTRDR